MTARPVVLAIAAGALFAGQNGAGAPAPASLATARVVARPQEPPSGAPPVLEFDLPPEYWGRGPDGEYVIRGFRLGFFQPDVGTPLQTRDVAIEDVEVVGQLGRIPLTDIMPRGYGRVVVRMQSLAQDEASLWSEPSPPVTLPDESAPRRRSPRPPIEVELARHPALVGALKQVLDRSPLPEEVRTFRRIQDLATAVALSRRLELPFPELCKALKGLRGPPERTLQEAVRRLRPSLDHQQVVREARAEGRTLLRSAPTPKLQER
jgi:hypothetical protein